MNKQFVTYKIALALKELGMDEPCLAQYTFSNEHNYLDIKGVIFEPVGDRRNILAPLWQQAIDWFFDNCDFVIVIDMHKDGGNYGRWQYHIYNGSNELINHCGWWEDSYKTREYAILKAIELIKKK